MFKKAVLILLPLLILLTLLGAVHLAARTTTPTDPIPIRLQVATFDPLTGEPDIPDGGRLAIQANRPATYLVQFTGPVRDEWKAAVEQAGVRLYGYIPDHAFIARMDPSTAQSVQSLPFVRWAGPYHPAYRLATAFQTSEVLKTSEVLAVTVQTLPNADLDALAGQVEAWGGEVQGQATNDIAGYLRASLSTDRLTDLAALDDVLWVEPYFEPQLLNDAGGGTIMQADEIRTSLGLYGSGQIVAVADSGLDTGDLNTLHPDVGGRVIQTYCLGRPAPCDWSDYVGHGTHVVGSVLGDGSVSGDTYAGTAPQAQLVFQSLGDAWGGLTGIPTDTGDLMRDAYDDGARIHTNSWGGRTGGTSQDPEFGGYVLPSQQVDQAMWEHKDLLVLFAAGNDGTDADSDGVVDPDSVGQPGTAKNVLTVGASENDRDSIASTWGDGLGLSSQGDLWVEPIASDKKADNPDGMAAFSSRGPTDDGRVKPDIVAPGTYIASLRTHQYVFDDDMEAGSSAFITIPLSGGTGDSWQYATDDPHSPTHYWKATVSGNYGTDAMTLLMVPPMNVMPTGSRFDIIFWHKYSLSGDDELRVIFTDSDLNPLLWRTLNVSGTQSTYGQTVLSQDIPELLLLGVDPANFWLGFAIGSQDANFDSQWWLDDVRVEGSDWGTMSSVGLAQPGDAVDEAYVMMGGTSMATPLTAGAAALVREWLTTIQDIANPSAALMKAVLINGAADMSPGQYGSGGSQEIPALRPNDVTGWGRVDLVESLDPPDPRAIWLMDNTSGLSTGGSAVYTLTVGASQTLSSQEGEGTTGVAGPHGTDQLLQNGNFDTGAWTPWQTAGSPVLTDTVYRSASYSARLGGINDTHDYVYQEVTVPSDVTEATLDFWYRVSGDDPDPDENLCAEILDSGLTTVLAGDCLALSPEPQDQWLNFQLVITGTQLTPLLGQTVYVALSVLTNAANPSTAWIDDASFSVTTPGPLRITLAWTDYPAEPAAAAALVNDLDMEVIAPGGTHYYGNEGLYASGQCLRGGQWDACNNVEGVIIPGAADGTYTVTVHGYNVVQGGSQPFALVASGDDLQGSAPPAGPTTVYLPAVMSNYDSRELLQNGDFDTGTWTPWLTDIGSPALTDQVYHSAPYAARLGGYNDAADYVYQEVTVPSNATQVTLDFWYRVSGDDPDPDEVLCYEIIDSQFNGVLAGGCLALYLEPQDQWLNLQPVVSGTDLTPLLGQTVFVALDVFTNATNPGTAWVDDASFKVTGVGP